MDLLSLSDFLKLAFQRGYHFKRSWRIQLNCELRTYRKEPYYLYPEDGKVLFMDENEVLFEVDMKPNQEGMLIHHKQRIQLTSGALPNLKENVETMYGIWLLNALATAPYGDRIPYQNTAFNKAMLGKLLFDAKESGVLDKINDGPIIIDTLSKLEYVLTGDLDWTSKSLNKAMYAEDKKKTAAVKKFINEHKDTLGTITTQAKIDEFIVAQSKAHYSTIGAGEYVGGKIHSDVLKKTEGAFGAERDMLGNTTEYITTPLKEGLDMNNLPAYINASRAGSYGRGAQTALAGAEVNNDYRALWERLVLNGDCKTKLGVYVTPLAFNYKQFVGQALVGTDKYLTAEDLKPMIGKRIHLRTAAGCKFNKSDTCSICGGEKAAKFPASIATSTSLVDSNVMLKSMAAMHSTGLQLLKIDLADFCHDE